ncbi:MAG TPA: hypothetical protein VH740_05465 [Vicinamibacterales bacterium]
MTLFRKPPGKSPTDNSPTAKDGAKRRPGRPPIHQEPWTKVTVVLFDRQITFLDRLAANIRAEHGASISRAQLIRALVDSVGDSETGGHTTPDVDARILAKLGIRTGQR